MLTIKFERKNKFGNELLYPTCEKAELFCELLKVKTMPRDRLSILSKLAYQIEISGGETETI